MRASAGGLLVGAGYGGLLAVAGGFGPAYAGGGPWGAGAAADLQGEATWLFMGAVGWVAQRGSKQLGAGCWWVLSWGRHAAILEAGVPALATPVLARQPALL